MIVVGALANEFTLAVAFSDDGSLDRSSIVIIRWLEVIFVVSGTVALLMRDRLTQTVTNLIAFRLQHPITHAPIDGRVLVLSLVIPWTINLLVVENVYHLERFWWLWPLQVIFLVNSIS